MRALLDEIVPFIEGRRSPDSRGLYYEPTQSAESGTRLRALRTRRSTRASIGAHGLPLMHGGDWNDGMNRVGIEGRGESVWLGWFLCATLADFATDRRAPWRLAHDPKSGGACRCAGEGGSTARPGTARGTGALTSTTVRHGARRTTASAGSIRLRRAGPWISGAADPVRARQAMEAVSEYLVKRGDDLVLLFNAAVRHEHPRPRIHPWATPRPCAENGGQYTHAAAGA
jgi:cyclic beta-1,2-glucan synthetase